MTIRPGDAEDVAGIFHALNSLPENALSRAELAGKEFWPKVVTP